MFTLSDIIVLIMLVGSGILIWVARRSNSVYSGDASKAHDQESSSVAEQMEIHDETNNHTDSGQSEEKDVPCNCK